jgi:hypothetical protein
MVLDPLAEIVIGVLMAVVVGLGQRMVDFQRRGEGRERQQQQHQSLA